MKHHTLEIQARVLTDTGQSIVALVVRDNARGLDVDPVTVHLSLSEAVRVAEMLWGVVGDVRRADASGRQKQPVNADVERLRAALTEIAENCEGVVRGELPHFTRKDIADAAAHRARAALARADDAPDARCVTTPDGGCASEACMHDPKP